MFLSCAIHNHTTVPDVQGFPLLLSRLLSNLLSQGFAVIFILLSLSLINPGTAVFHGHCLPLTKLSSGAYQDV